MQLKLYTVNCKIKIYLALQWRNHNFWAHNQNLSIMIRGIIYYEIIRKCIFTNIYLINNIKVFSIENLAIISNIIFFGFTNLLKCLSMEATVTSRIKKKQ